MMIPESFLNLQERIHFEARYFRLHKEKGPPILSWNEILKYDCMYAYIIHYQGWIQGGSKGSGKPKE